MIVTVNQIGCGTLCVRACQGQTVLLQASQGRNRPSHSEWVWILSDAHAYGRQRSRRVQECTACVQYQTCHTRLHVDIRLMTAPPAAQAYELSRATAAAARFRAAAELSAQLLITITNQGRRWPRPASGRQVQQYLAQPRHAACSAACRADPGALREGSCTAQGPPAWASGHTAAQSARAGAGSGCMLGAASAATAAECSCLSV